MQKAPARRSVSTGSLADSRSSCSVAKRSTACVQDTCPVRNTAAIHHDYGEMISYLLCLSGSIHVRRKTAEPVVSLCFVGCPGSIAFSSASAQTCYCNAGVGSHKRACLAPSAALAMTALVLQAALSCH